MMYHLFTFTDEHENETELFCRAHEHYRELRHRALTDRAADYGGRLNLSEEMNLIAGKTNEASGELNVP